MPSSMLNYWSALLDLVNGGLDERATSLFRKSTTKILDPLEHSS